MNMAYEPSRSLSAKISRRVTPFLARRIIPVNLTRPLVSFTFDDCPKSAITHGVKPLEAEGWKSTIYVSGGLLGQTNHHGKQIDANDVRALHNKGHEIGGHTWSHIDAQALGAQSYIDDIDRNQDFIRSLGVPAFRTFAYPYGQTQPAIKRLLENKFCGMRGINPGFHRKDVDLNQIKSTPLFSGDCLASAHKMIGHISEAPAWITFFSHDIRSDHSPWGCTPAEFQGIIDAVKDIGADVMPVDQAIAFIRRPT